jgi:hypothetical protein
MAKTPRFSPEEKQKIGQLWVTSVAGTTLVILLQSIGHDWSSWTIWPAISVGHIDWGFTADRIVRYLFAISFATYLVLAYLANEARADPSPWLGITFDIIQSLAVFGALAALGFVTQDFALFGTSLHLPFAFAFAAIAINAGFTFCRHFFDTERGDNWLSVQIVRGLVMAFAFLAILYVWYWGPRSIGTARGWPGTLFFIVLSYFGLYVYSVLAFRHRGRRPVSTQE